MIIPKSEVADILAGEQDEVHVAARGCEVGTVEAVRTSKSSKPVCWVFILERWEHRDGGLVVRFRRAPAPHEPRYLARQGGAFPRGMSKGKPRKTERRTPSEVTVRLPDGRTEVKAPKEFPKPIRSSETGALDREQYDRGYTSTAFRALDGEPECVPEQYQDEISKPLSQRDELLRLERVAARRVERWRKKRERKRAA